MEHCGSLLGFVGTHSMGGDDSRLSMNNFTVGASIGAEDSRCAPLTPEELAEWRCAGDSSLHSGGELLSSSRDVSLGVPSLAAHVEQSRGRLFDQTSACASAGGTIGHFEPDVASSAEATTETAGKPAVWYAQWMQPHSSDSSADGAADAASRGGQEPFAGKAKKAPAPKGTTKGKVVSSGGKEGGRGGKAAHTGIDGDGEGKLSGMWTGEENSIFFDALREHGRSFPNIHQRLQATKTREQVRCYYYRVIKKINQIIAPSGMKLDKTTGGASEGAGVIEAILTWWQAMRGTNGNDASASLLKKSASGPGKRQIDEDTSANLFKKSAALTDQERVDFVESIKRAGVSTTLPAQNLAQSAQESAEKTEMSPTVRATIPSRAPALPLAKSETCNLESKLYCDEVLVHPQQSSTGRAVLPLSSSPESSSSRSSPLSTQTQNLEANQEQESQDATGCARSSHAQMLQPNAPDLANAEESMVPTADLEKESICGMSQRQVEHSVAAKSQQTPLRHERVDVKADANMTADSQLSPGSGTHGISAAGAGQLGGTPRLKLKLLASHPVLAQLIERCGFNAQLQLTFKPGGKSMGSIATHLHLKWGKDIHDELLYLMPHRIDPAVCPVFLLHSSKNCVGGYAWSAIDRHVQASDVYSDFGQPKIFQLSYSVQGLDDSVFDALVPLFSRYQPRKTVQAMLSGGSGYTEAIGAGVNTSGTNAERAAMTFTTGKEPHTPLSGIKGSVGQEKTHGCAEHSPLLQATIPGGQALTPATVAAEQRRPFSSAFEGGPVCANSMRALTATGRNGVHINEIKPSVRKGMVNIVDFVPFLHHRSGNISCSETGRDRLDQHTEMSREPLDLSDIVPDTRTADQKHHEPTTECRTTMSQQGDTNSLSAGGPLFCPQAIFSMSTETKIDSAHNATLVGQTSENQEGASGVELVEEGLLGQAAANSRDMPILPPDSRDGLCTDSRDGLYTVGWDKETNSMHAMLEHSRQNTHLEPNASSLTNRLLPDQACVLDSRESFGMLKRGRDEEIEEAFGWQRNVKRDMLA